MLGMRSGGFLKASSPVSYARSLFEILLHGVCRSCSAWVGGPPQLDIAGRHYILWLVSISAALLDAMEESMLFVMIAVFVRLPIQGFVRGPAAMERRLRQPRAYVWSDWFAGRPIGTDLLFGTGGPVRC